MQKNPHAHIETRALTPGDGLATLIDPWTLKSSSSEPGRSG
jgi:hypothetical protein